MSGESQVICENLKPILIVIGYVVAIIKIFVPIALIVMGMIKLAHSIIQKDDSEIKKAQDDLVKKLIVSVVIFIVPTIVSTVMGIIGSDDYKACWTCIAHPGAAECGGLNALFTGVPE